MPSVSDNTPISRRRTSPIVNIWKIVLSSSSDYVAVDDITSDHVALFAILDGHGGAEVS